MEGLAKKKSVEDCLINIHKFCVQARDNDLQYDEPTFEHLKQQFSDCLKDLKEFTWLSYLDFSKTSTKAFHIILGDDDDHESDYDDD
jgi:hypothetical protein